MKFSEIQEACWKGYRQQGMKKKGGRQVPNCVPVEEVKTGPEMTLNELLYTAAAKAMRDASREGIDLDYEDAIQQAAKIYGIPYKPSQLPKLQAQLKALDARIAPLKQQLDLKKQQRKQQKYGVAPAVAQPQSNVTPATGRIKPPAKTLEETEAELAEDLKKWFKEKWVRFGPDGKIRGDCARGSSKEGKPKCLPQSKAHALGKKGRASAAAKKRREDPNPERRGPARNVATKVGEVKDINAVRDLIKQSGGSNAFQQADDKRKQAEALLDQLKDLQSKRQQLAMKRIKPTPEYYQELDRIVTAIGDLGYEAEGPTNGQYTLRAKFKEQHDWDDADEFGMPGSEFFPDDDRLRDGDYVRDRQDGEYGEIFRMSGDPSERRVRILDRDGKGWYISPERLVAVDRTDPDIMKYFGKRRHRDMDESAVAEGFEYGNRVQHPKYGAGQVIKVYSNGVITVNFPNYPDPIDKKPGVQSNFAPGDKDYQSLKPMVSEKQDACYRKVKSRYKVWPSAYASGALVQCRKKGASRWGNKKK